MPIEPPKIFISHSWDNKPLVRRLEAELKAAGTEVWVDHAGVRGGDNLPKEINAALAWCNTVVLIWSQSAAQSHWVELEWTNAVALRKLVIPCRLDKTALPALLANLLYVDFIEIEKGMTQLREAVQLAQKPVTNTPTSNIERVARFLRFELAGDLPPIWNVPHHRNPNFTGRGQLLADLRQALTAEKAATLTQTQAVHGLGGVGKTQLALEYAYRYAADYGLVWWLRSEEPATLAADYAGLATALDLPEKEAREQNAIIKAVRQWLDRHSGWLLIFDNASQAQDLLPYLPFRFGGTTGHVIITSRYPHWKGVAKPLRVPVWPQEESVAFLLRRTGTQCEAMVDAVAEALGDLPLALEQAAAYVEATGISWADYLDLFRQYRQDLLKEHQPLAYDATVATTWEISFQKVKAEAPAAVDLLNVCAFLAPDEIPRQLLIEGRDHLPEALAQALAQPLVVNKAIASLVRYSLIEATNETLSLHRLVQAVTLDRLREDEQKALAQAVLQIVDSAWPQGTFDIRSWPQCARLLPHSYAVVEHVEKLKIESSDLAALLNRMGLYLNDRAAYKEAELLYRRSLKIREQQLGADHLDTATSLNKLASLLQDQGKYDEAEPLYRHALEIYEQQLGPDHPLVAMSLNNLASLLQDQDKYDEAEPLSRRALDVREKHLGPNHPDTATSLNSLAELLRAQGQNAAAEPLHRRAIAIFEKTLGPEHPNTRTARENLEILLSERSRQ
jgi:tetratricopeptide (TPR) repeat protein